MNQKYLQGLSSNMESPNEAVFFEATPENITAFFNAAPMGTNVCHWNCGRPIFFNCKNGTY